MNLLRAVKSPPERRHLKPDLRRDEAGEPPDCAETTGLEFTLGILVAMVFIGLVWVVGNYVIYPLLTAGGWPEH